METVAAQQTIHARTRRAHTLQLFAQGFGFELRFVARSLISRPLRTILTLSSIMLGVAVILATGITNKSTLRSIDDVFGDASGRAKLMVVAADADQGGMSERVAKKADEMPGIRSAVPVLQVATQLANEEDFASASFFTSGARSLLLYGIDPVLDVQVREYTLVAGRFLRSDAAGHDVVLVEEYAASKGLKVGSTIRVMTPAGVEELKVIGLISKEGPGRLNNGDFGVIPLSTAQSLFSRTGKLDQIDLLVEDKISNPGALETLRTQLQGLLGQDFTVAYPSSQGRRMTQMLTTYNLGLSFFGALALFVGGFLIYNVLTMTVVERTREIGLLRAVGMSRGKVGGQVLIESVLLGIVGSILGVGLGIALSFGLIRLMEWFLEEEFPIVTIPPSSLVLSVSLGLIVTLVAALWPARSASMISPLEALRIRGRTREGWVVRRGWRLGVVMIAVTYIVVFLVPLPSSISVVVIQLGILSMLTGATLLIPATISAWVKMAKVPLRALYGHSGWLGSQNVLRARMRTTLTATALLVGVSMVIGIRGLSASFKQDITTWMDSYIGGDLIVYSAYTMRIDIGQRLQSIAGVENVSPVRYIDTKQVLADDATRSITFMALDPDSYGAMTDFMFASDDVSPARAVQKLKEGDAVFASSFMADKYNLKPGDMITLETRRGRKDFEIAAIVVDFFNQGAVVQGNRSDLRRYFGLSDVNLFLVSVQPGYAVPDVKNAIEVQYGRRRHLTVDSNAGLKAGVLQGNQQTFAMFDVLSYIAIVVAALGIVNTLSMNITERTRELGALRSMGMLQSQIIKMILAEALMIGLIGGVFGILFGLFLEHIFIMGTWLISGYQVGYKFPLAGAGVTLGITFVISQIAAAFPARRAVRMRIVDAIQYE